MNSQQSLSILSCFQPPQLSWQSPFLTTLWYCLPTSSVCLFFLVLSLCPVRLSLLNQRTLKCGQTILLSVSWPGSGIHCILQWLLGSFCKPPHWSHGPCMKCSVASGSNSSQRPVFFSLTLQSRSMIHRHTEIWKWQGSVSASSLIQDICCYLSKCASAV